MDLDLHKLPSRHFEPRLYGVGAWTNHLHLAYDLMAALRPSVFVELGIDRGESFFAFCQAAAEHQTGSRCFAVDTWEGDGQAGHYDETTYAQVVAHCRAHYSAFARLLRGTFAMVRPQFFDGTIDLLHLDGLHSEEAVRQDLADWLPKLRPGGILLLHDVNVRERGFGVWKCWQELCAQGRSWTHAAGPGLGLWQKPPNESLPPLVESLLLGTNEQRNALEQHYAQSAEALQAKITQEWSDGRVRDLPFLQQTVIQIFHTTDGVHREENSVQARIGHGEWNEVFLTLPSGAGAAPLRIDFVSPWTIIEIATLRLRAGGQIIYEAASPAEFDRLLVQGDAERLPDPDSLRVRITGVDPQLFLPPLPAAEELSVELRLRVFPHQ